MGHPLTFNPTWGTAAGLSGTTLPATITISSLEVLGVLEELHAEGPVGIGNLAGINRVVRADLAITGSGGFAAKVFAGGAMTAAANGNALASFMAHTTIAIDADVFTGVEYRGVWVRNPAVSAGTLALNHGIYVDSMAAGTTDYAIFTNAETVRFGDVVNTTESYQVDGTKVVGNQGASVADASGGATIDTQARTAINALLARLRTHGLIAT